MWQVNRGTGYLREEHATTRNPIPLVDADAAGKARGMRTLPWSSVLCLAVLAAPVHAAPTAEEQAVLAPLQAFLAGIQAYDKAAMLAQTLPDAVITRVSAGKTTQQTVRSLVERFPTSTGRKLEERIHDPLIRIDEDLAVIWAPYEFLVDGKVDHCGVDLVEAVRRDGRWLISGLADTSRKACGAPAAKPQASSGR